MGRLSAKMLLRINDIFTVIGDICDALDERAIRAAFIVRSVFSAVIKQVRG